MNMASSGGRGAKTTYDVYVGNLPVDADEVYLKKLFSQVGGEVDSTFICRKDERNVYGFVKYLSLADAEAASKLANLSIDGKKLTVRFSMKSGKGGRGGVGTGSGPPARNKPYDQQQQKPSFGNKPDLVSNHGSGQGQWQAASKPVVQREEIVMITHVEGPLMFYVQLIEDQAVQNLSQVAESLPQICNTAPPVVGKLHLDKVYAAQFSEDGQWYRCKQQQHKPVLGTRVGIQFIDYGNGEEKDVSEIVELPPFLANIPPLAQKYVLYGLKPVHEEGTIGYDQGKEHLQKITEGKSFCAKVYSSKSHFVPVILENKEVDINQEMLNRGFGERRFYHGTKGPSPPQQQQGKKIPRVPSHQEQSVEWSGQPPPNQFGGFDEGSIGTWVNQTPVVSPPRAPIPLQPLPNTEMAPHRERPPLLETPPPHEGQPPPMTFIQSHDLGVEKAEIDHKIRELYSKMELMANQFHAEKQNLQKQRDDSLRNKAKAEKLRDQAFLEVSTTKGQLKKLQETHSSLTVKLGEANVSFKVKHLVSGVNKIKHLRRQFPTDGQTRDVIETGIYMALDPNKVTTTGLEIISRVQEDRQKYEQSQVEIKACKDLAAANSLIEGRDYLKKELYSHMKDFLAAMDTLPLSRRSVDLREAVHNLKATHAVFMQAEISNVIPMAELATLYPNWKEQKTDRFQNLRTATNTRHNEVDSSLRQIQQQFSLDLSSGCESPGAKTDLDELLNKFNDAIHNELHHTDMSLSPDSSFISLVVQTLEKELTAELCNIDKLRNLQDEYKELEKCLSPWLEIPPDVSELQAVRKTVKSLKSKLRHKLADKLDLEETDETKNGDLAHVEQELSEIRRQLQSAFIREDQHLAELADLANNHFPELYLKYPDIGLENAGEYAGLVKLGRSLDQFDLKPLMESKSTLLRSSFCGNPIVLKEYLVGENLGICKSEFLKIAMAYNSNISPNLVPIDSIFFLKGERQVFVQVPFYEKNLVMAQEAGLTEEEQFLALYGVVRGLQVLHNANLVHGSIHPNDVFLNIRRQGVLAELDFNKTQKMQMENPFVSSSGLRFISPEFAAHGQLSQASDIFSLGLFALWLHFPGVDFQMQPNGVPDLKGLEMSKRLAELLERLLDPQPSRRPSTSQILKLSFFSFSPHARCISPTMVEKEITLQLRPKTPPDGRPGSPVNGKTLSGILKNGSSVYSDRSSSPSLPAPLPDVTGKTLNEPTPCGDKQSEVPEPCELDPMMILDSAGSAELVSADNSLLVSIQIDEVTEQEDSVPEPALVQNIPDSPVSSLVNELSTRASELTPPTLDTPQNTPAEPTETAVPSSVNKSVLQQAALLAALKEEQLNEEAEDQADGDEISDLEDETEQFETPDDSIGNNNNLEDPTDPDTQNSQNGLPRENSPTPDTYREGNASPVMIDTEIRDSLVSSLSGIEGSNLSVDEVKKLVDEALQGYTGASNKDCDTSVEHHDGEPLSADDSYGDTSGPPGLEEDSS